MHNHAGEALNAHAGQGPVVVDIGDDVGALILYTEADLDGAEIEISPVGQDEHRQHVAVLSRTWGERTAYAAVYPALKAGSYRLWQPNGRPTAVVAITGGQINELRWSDIAEQR